MFASKKLVNVAEGLYHTNCNQASSMDQLSMEVQSARAQLEDQIHQNKFMVNILNQNQSMMLQLFHTEPRTSNVQNLLGHKDAELSSLMAEVTLLQPNNSRLKESGCAKHRSNCRGVWQECRYSRSSEL